MGQPSKHARISRIDRAAAYLMCTRIKLAMRSGVCGGLGLAGKGKKRSCLHAGMLQELREGERLVFNACTQTEQLKWTT